MDRLTAAFIPLTDAAPLIVADTKGFARAQGIDLRLQRETSWDRLQTALLSGQVDAAHMLAPLAVAAGMGSERPAVALAAPMKLNVNGNSFVVAPALAAGLARDHQARLADPQQTAEALAKAIRTRAEPVALGVVHKYSTHALLLRDFLARAGLDPDRDIALVRVDPSRTTDAMRAGEIQGFVAGEPWGTVAILEGLAELVTTTASLWHRGVEKVLAMRAEWLEGNCDLADRLILAIDRAAAWCDDPANHAELARLLERPEYVGQPAEFLMTALSGLLQPARDAPTVAVTGYVLFHRNATGLPTKADAEWLFTQLARWKLVPGTDECRAQVTAIFRPDIYLRATRRSGPDAPEDPGGA